MNYTLIFMYVFTYVNLFLYLYIHAPTSICVEPPQALFPMGTKVSRLPRPFLAKGRRVARMMHQRLRKMLLTTLGIPNDRPHLLSISHQVEVGVQFMVQFMEKLGRKIGGGPLKCRRGRTSCDRYRSHHWGGEVSIEEVQPSMFTLG